MTIRVGIASERVHGPVNGPNRYRTRLCEKLASDPRVEPVFFSFTGETHPVYEQTSVTRHVLPQVPGAAEWKLRTLDLDVIHLDAALHRYPFVSALSVPVVATIHGIEPVVLPEYECSRTTEIQKRYVWPPLTRLLDRIITVSRSGKEQLVEHYPVPSDRVNVVYNGIDHETYAPSSCKERAEIRRRYDLPESYFLTVNSYSPRKNPARLIEAFDRIAGRTDHHLVIVGPGWDAEPVEPLLDGCRHRDRIVLLGAVPEEDLPPLYSGATCTVTSTIHENFGLPLAESMACGTPVVASAVYAVPEVVEDGGLLLDDPDDVDGFASAMARLVERPDERSRLTDRAKSVAQQFTWDRCADETVAVYESVATDR